VRKEDDLSEKFNETARDKNFVNSSNEQASERPKLKEKKINFTITFRDSGCGISI
jgi:hypothetical protein